MLEGVKRAGGKPSMAGGALPDGAFSGAETKHAACETTARAQSTVAMGACGQHGFAACMRSSCMCAACSESPAAIARVMMAWQSCPASTSWVVNIKRSASPNRAAVRRIPKIFKMLRRLWRDAASLILLGFAMYCPRIVLSNEV